MKHLLLLFTSSLLLSLSASISLKCGDLLENYAEKPQLLEFVECEAGTGQVILEAKYLVSGENSEEVEKFLIKKFGMGKLKFTCCGWESRNGKHGYHESVELKRVNPNYVLEISMYGSAEMENEEGETELEFDRSKIGFHVIVKILDV